MPAGGDNSFQDEEPSFQERVSRDSPGRNAKRNADDYDRDPSWLVQQSHDSAPDRSYMTHGRKTIRTQDNQMHDDLWGRTPYIMTAVAQTPRRGPPASTQAQAKVQQQHALELLCCTSGFQG
jgi:hypothetical protein